MISLKTPKKVDPPGGPDYLKLLTRNQNFLNISADKGWVEHYYFSHFWVKILSSKSPQSSAHEAFLLFDTIKRPNVENEDSTIHFH